MWLGALILTVCNRLPRRSLPSKSILFRETEQGSGQGSGQGRVKATSASPNDSSLILG